MAYHVVYSYTCRCKQKHNDDFNERTRTRFFINNIPLTLYSRKGCERVDVGFVLEVSWRRRETATYWLQVSLTIAALLPHSTGLLDRGSWGPKPSVWSWFSLQHLISNSNSNWPQLTQAVCVTWLYNCLTPTCFLWAYASAPNSTTSTGQGDIPISSTGCTGMCISLIDRSVESQYVTIKLCGLFNSEAILIEEQLLYSSTHCWEGKRWVISYPGVWGRQWT